MEINNPTEPRLFKYDVAELDNEWVYLFLISLVSVYKYDVLSGMTQYRIQAS